VQEHPLPFPSDAMRGCRLAHRPWWTARVRASARVRPRPGAARPTRTSDGERHEGSSQRQENLWEVQGDPAPWSRPGHLPEPPPQAAPGL